MTGTTPPSTEEQHRPVGLTPARHLFPFSKGRRLATAFIYQWAPKIGISLLVASGVIWTGDRVLEWVIPQVVDLDAIQADVLNTVNKQVLPNVTQEPGWKASTGPLQIRMTVWGPEIHIPNIHVARTIEGSPNQNRLTLKEAAILVRYWPAIIGGTPEIDTLELDRLLIRLPHPVQGLLKQPPSSLTPAMLLIKPIDPNAKPSTTGNAQLTKVPATQKTVTALPPKKAAASTKPVQGVSTAPSEKVKIQNTTVILQQYDVQLGPWVTSLWQGLQSSVAGFRFTGKHFRLSHLKSNRPLKIKGDLAVWVNGHGNHPDRALLSLNTHAVLPKVFTDALQHPERFRDIPRHALDPEIYNQLQFTLHHLDLGLLGQLVKPQLLPLKGSGAIEQLELDFKRGLWEQRGKVRITADKPFQVTMPQKPWHLPAGVVQIQGKLQNQKDLRDLSLLVDADPYQVKLNGNMALPRTLDQMTAKHWGGLHQYDVRLETSPLPTTLFHYLPNSLPIGRLAQESIQTPANGSASQFEIDLQAKGQGKTLPIVNGEITLENWSLFNALHEIDAKLLFKETSMALKPLKAQFHQTPIQLTGGYNWKTQRLENAHLQATGLQWGQVLALYQTLHQSASPAIALPYPSALDRLSVSGQSHINLKANGPLKTPDLTGTMSLKQFSLGTKGSNAEAKSSTSLKPIISGLNSEFKFDHQTFNLGTLQFLLQEQPVNLSGQVNWGKSTVNLSLNAPKIPLKTILETASLAQALISETAPPVIANAKNTDARSTRIKKKSLRISDSKTDQRVPRPLSIVPT